MATACKLAPVVFKRNGTKVEEKDSKLFRDIKEAVKDNDTAWKMWAYTKTSDFKSKYDDLEFDELGEVTFPSLVKALGLTDAYNSQKGIEQVTKEYGFNDTVFEDANTAVRKINEFNNAEKKFVATLSKVDGGHVVKVSPRNGINLDTAKQQSFNYALTGEIIDLLRSIGFNVEFINDPKYKGLFDPENTTLKDGLITIIKIAKGEMGEEALPEEFSHLIIEGLINHPLVQRLLASLDDAQVQEVLGDMYEQYNTEYDGDFTKLKKEAAGQMLAQYITGKGTISKPVIQPKRPLLSRIWNWAKNLFSKVTNKQISDSRQQAQRAVEGIYNLVSSGEAIQLIDKRNIINAEKLYALQKEFDSISKVALAGETITAKMLQHERRIGKKDRISDTTKNLKKIREAYHWENEKLEIGDPLLSVQEFLSDALRHIQIITSDMVSAKKNEESGWLGDMQLINQAAGVVREINTMVQGYQGIISAIANFSSLDDNELGQLGISKQEADYLAGNLEEKDNIEANAKKCNDLLNSLIKWKQATSRNIITAAARTILPNDIVRGIGSRRNEIMSLEQIMEHADRDINYLDRWFSALSDADDAYLTLFDGIVKNQQYERDEEMRDWYAQIAAADEKLRKAGFSSDFMYERDKDGVPTGRIISIYDWNAFNEEHRERIEYKRKEQERLGKTDEWYRKEINKWKSEVDPKTKKYRLIREYVDPEIQKIYLEKGKQAVPDDAIFDEVPNPEVYSKNANLINNLAPAQREYYEEMMRIKRQMMLKIPHRGQGIYKVVYISKDFVEGVIDNTTGNPLKATKEHYVKKFVRRPDDIGFGTSENFGQTIKEILMEENDSEAASKKILNTLAEQIDDDIKTFISPRKFQSIINRYNRKVNSKEINRKEAIDAMAEDIINTIAMENFYVVDTDFANHTIQKLPIYYTRPLKDKRMLSTDFSGSIVAYSAMAVNYQKMNEVVDILEVGRDYTKERGLRQNEGGKPLMSRFTALEKTYRAYVEKAGSGSNISGRLDDYMASVVYEERKDNEGTIDVFNVNLDWAKTVDAIKDYTGLLGLGFNLFSTISNIAVGKLQQWIEAAAGEYFTAKDYAKAVGQYSALMFGANGAAYEIASPVKKNKLSLLIQMFDPMGDYYENLRDPNFQKSAVSRILGNGMLAYIGMNAGEHMLHCQTMLAILNNIKLTNVKTQEKISLYDALEVKEVNGITKLVLKDDLAYERELIDNTGNPKTNKNYGRPVKDENGRIKTELVELSTPGVLADKEKTANFRKYVFKKKKVVRKVNDSLNGAFGVNDKGAIHKKALGRLIIQFRQWMPAHYMRRFARAHYDADLEKWREGYYTTVAKTASQIFKESKRAGIRAALEFKYMSEHEKANLRRATAEIAEFMMLLTLVRLGGRVKDRDRSWLNKMVLYQIRRMYLETGASMPANGGFFSNIFQLLQSPAASISTFEKFSKVVQLWNMMDEVQTGRFQGWSEWERDVFNLVPAFGQISKAIAFDDSMFSQFERED